MGRLTAAMPVLIEPGAEVRAMSSAKLLSALVCSPAEAKPCTRRDADAMEWLRAASSLLADRPTAAQEEMRARRLCAGCPVMTECLELALRGEPVEGVQGGATERSRLTLRHRRAERTTRSAASSTPATEEVIEVGAMAEHVNSPGCEQAGFLRALAGHLDRWDVAPVNISSDHAGGWVLQVFEWCVGGEPVRLERQASVGLTGWARSLGAAELSVRPLARQVNVGFSGALGDHPVQVWGCVDALREAMGLTDSDTTISVAELAHFAEHGTVPRCPGGEWL